MEYRKLPKGDEKISVFGLGSSSLGPAGAKETEATITMALENGINYFDMANAGDTLAKDHYLHLGKQAGDCIGCGHCDRRCPFHVHQSARMQKICAYFGQ